MISNGNISNVILF